MFSTTVKQKNVALQFKVSIDAMGVLLL